MKFMMTVAFLTITQISFASCEAGHASLVCKKEVERSLNTKLNPNNIRMSFQYFSDPETEYSATECHYYAKASNTERMGVIRMEWENCEVSGHHWSDLE